MALEKEKYNLSGMYFRVQNQETEKWESVTFEDLTLPQQEEILRNKNEEYLKQMIFILSDTLHEMGKERNEAKTIFESMIDSEKEKFEDYILFGRFDSYLVDGMIEAIEDMDGVNEFNCKDSPLYNMLKFIQKTTL